MRAIFINAKDQEVSVIYHSAQLFDIYNSIGCDVVEMIRLSEKDDLWIDEEGRINGTNYGFCLDGQIYLGNGLIFGHKNSECSDASVDIENVKLRVEFFIVV